MKLEIRDRDALIALSPIDIRAYLMSQGWADAGRFSDKASVFTRADSEGRGWEVLLPTRTNVADYAERMAETVSIIAKLENRSQIEVYGDLTAAGHDIIRLRVPEADSQGTIALQAGVVLFEETKNLLLAAACTAIRPRRSYHAGKVTDAVNYLNDVRLGQTERGSYVLTVLSPVNPAFRHPQQPLDQDFDLDPFPRLVTRKLAEALKATQLALDEAVATDDFAPFENMVQRGVSANLCEAIARLSQHGRGLDISMIWARVRPVPEENVRCQFTVENARILEEAAREFRRSEPRLDETVTGFVIALDRNPDEFDGNATLQVVLDNQPRRIRVQFAQDEYNTAIRAFQDKLPISLDGDIYPVGKRYELRNPRDLLLLSEVDEG